MLPSSVVLEIPDELVDEEALPRKGVIDDVGRRNRIRVCGIVESEIG